MAENIVISDFHHASLFHSLMYLFEKRLTFALYRPHGIDWYEEGFFDYPNPDFRTGVLITEPAIKETDPDKIDTTCESMGRLITLQEAKDRANEIKFFVSSLYESEPCFAKAIAAFSPGATLIRQVGNPNEAVRFTRHALCSDTQTFNRLDNTYHKVLYHQEFNLNIFKWAPLNSERWPRRLKQYVNFIRDNELVWPVWEKWTKAFPIETARWFEHGLKGKDGGFTSLTEMAKSMQDANFVVSIKHWDGYGHCVHNAYACGRPVIYRQGDYEEKIAGLLMEDMVTAVKLSGDHEADKKKLLLAFESDKMMEMAWEAYKRFHAIVNFDEEEITIRKWIEEI